MTITKMVAAMARGATDPVAVIDAALARIAAAQDALHGFIHVDAGRARARAQRAREGRAGPGSLHGIPIALKDVIDVAGMPTTANSRIRLAQAPPMQDSDIAARLEAAGAIIPGKLHCWELSVGGPCDDTPFPPARNPWNRAHEPGGSSSGSAVAVAAGLVPAAIGGDTGGSIRLPASYCGIVGFKPSFGLVPMGGVVPFAGSLDIAGPLARSVADAALVTSVIADRAMPLTRRWTGTRVGIPSGLLAHTAPSAAVSRYFEAARHHLERLGAIVSDIPFASAPLFNACYFIIARSEAYATWRDVLEQEGSSLSRITRRSLAMGALLTAADLVDATRLRAHLTQEVARLFADLDVLCLPTTPDIAGPLLPRDGVTRPDTAPYTRPFSLVGAPAITLPCGLSPEGLPIGLQLVGAWNGDADLLGLAHHLETSQDWPWRDLQPDAAQWT